MKSFYLLIANTIISSITNFTVWFAIVFYAYLQTQSVLATSLISGLYLVTTAVTGIWFGSLVDRFKKKNVMLASSAGSFVSFAVGLAIYLTVPASVFTSVASPLLWVFVSVLLVGVIMGNIRGIALPALITTLVPEDQRDRANGLAGLASGIGFMVTSVISGVLVGHSGMYLVLILACVATVVAILHLLTISIPEMSEKKRQQQPQKVDIRGTIKEILRIKGMLALILFTTFNNFLGGVFMALMDAYGLSLVSVQVWGFLWGFLSLAFILGGALIAKWGLGKNPLHTMFVANMVIWSIASVFTTIPSIILLTAGMFVYMTVVPFIEAAEHTIIQKLIPPERQGRVFGFAQSVEQAASPLTAFTIGPIAQFVFIPFMTTGAGVELIGSWYGTGPDRGIALVFSLAGILGLIITILARNSRYYQFLSKSYLRKPDGVVPKAPSHAMETQ